MRRRGPSALAVAVTLALSACAGGSSEPTEAWPPTSELIFRLSTTTTRPPSSSDPVPIEEIGATVAIPRDWQWETEGLRYGEGAAVFQAVNRAGALIVVGALAGLAADGATAPSNTAEAAAVLATLLDLAPGEPGLALVAEATTEAGRRATYQVEQEDGTPAVVDVVVAEDVFVAFLYEDGLPDNRVAQGEEALLSLTLG
jgi:hypothetical protein